MFYNVVIRPKSMQSLPVSAGGSKNEIEQEQSLDEGVEERVKSSESKVEKGTNETGLERLESERGTKYGGLCFINL